jgi:hypothetical protein
MEPWATVLQSWKSIIGDSSARLRAFHLDSRSEHIITGVDTVSQRRYPCKGTNEIQGRSAATQKVCSERFPLSKQGV